MNGMVTVTGNSVSDTATYTCNSGFELIGDSTEACTAAANGNSATFSAPECRREYSMNFVEYFASLFSRSTSTKLNPPTIVASQDLIKMP